MARNPPGREGPGGGPGSLGGLPTNWGPYHSPGAGGSCGIRTSVIGADGGELTDIWPVPEISEPWNT